MVRGLYTAWTGLRNEEKRMDVVTNNMANADTTGYKKVDVTSQSFDRQLAVKIDDPTIGPNIKQGIGGVNLGVKIGETYYDMSQGNFRQTEDQYNLALSGSGFFTISTTDKSGTTTTRYTRDGDFTVTRDGYLVTKDGDYVLAEGGNRIRMLRNCSWLIFRATTHYPAMVRICTKPWMAPYRHRRMQQSIRDIWKCQMSIWSQRWLI